MRRPVAILRSCVLGLVSCLVVVTLGYLAGWNFLAGLLEQRVRALQTLSPDWTLEIGQIQRSGFPGAVVLTLQDATLHGPADLHWQADNIRVRMLPLPPWNPDVHLDGRHRLRQGDRPVLELTAGQAVLELPTALSRGTIRLRASGLSSTDSVRLDSLELDGRWPVAAGGDAVQSWTLHLRGLSLPDNRQPWPGPLTDAAVTLRVQGALGSGTPKDVLTRWRDDGGTVEIDTLNIDWAPLQLVGKGTLTLDRQFRPELAGTLTAQGMLDTLAALNRGGSLGQKELQVARQLLGALEQGDSGAPKGQITVPVTVQNGAAYLGPVPLLPVQPLFSGDGAGQK